MCENDQIQQYCFLLFQEPENNIYFNESDSSSSLNFKDIQKTDSISQFHYGQCGHGDQLLGSLFVYKDVFTGGYYDLNRHNCYLLYNEG